MKASHYSSSSFSLCYSSVIVAAFLPISQRSANVIYDITLSTYPNYKKHFCIKVEGKHEIGRLWKYHNTVIFIRSVYNTLDNTSQFSQYPSFITKEVTSNFPDQPTSSFTSFTTPAIPSRDSFSCVPLLLSNHIYRTAISTNRPSGIVPSIAE